MPRAFRLILIAVWLGGALAIVVVVAPAAFAVLPSRALAGDLVGQVLPAVLWAAVGVAILAVLLPSTPTSRAGRGAVAAALAALIGAPLADLFVVDPRIAAIRAAAVPVEALAPTDPRRVLFGQLHLMSVALLGVAMVAAVTLLVVEARSGAPRDVVW